jgi:hypothetical protein
MSQESDTILHILAPGAPQSAVSLAQEQLITELNERGPIASMMSGDQEGTKGDFEFVGQIGLALLSSGIIKYIAQVLTEFVKRNERYTIKVGDVAIAKDHATEQDMERINKELLRILSRRHGG